mmetsp:Transcript_40411/g.117735  ORF Transcript_40411/g.117735 Transcript_40411/m.117735 type:complete len:228 (-) Transcript_40411:876-1559(-)
MRAATTALSHRVRLEGATALAPTDTAAAACGLGARTWRRPPPWRSRRRMRPVTRCRAARRHRRAARRRRRAQRVLQGAHARGEAAAPAHRAPSRPCACCRPAERRRRVQRMATGRDRAEQPHARARTSRCRAHESCLHRAGLTHRSATLRPRDGATRARRSWARRSCVHAPSRAGCAAQPRGRRPPPAIAARERAPLAKSEQAEARRERRAPRAARRASHVHMLRAS